MLGIETLVLWKSTQVFLTIEPSLHSQSLTFYHDWKQLSIHSSPSSLTNATLSSPPTHSRAHTETAALVRVKFKGGKNAFLNNSRDASIALTRTKIDGLISVHCNEHKAEIVQSSYSWVGLGNHPDLSFFDSVSRKLD